MASNASPHALRSAQQTHAHASIAILSRAHAAKDSHHVLRGDHAFHEQEASEWFLPLRQKWLCFLKLLKSMESMAGIEELSRDSLSPLHGCRRIVKLPPT